MERLLRHERLDTDPEFTSSVEDHKHWFYTFENFIKKTQADDQVIKAVNQSQITFNIRLH